MFPNRHLKVTWIGLLLGSLLLIAGLPQPVGSLYPTETPVWRSVQAGDLLFYLPLVRRQAPVSSTEWTQHAHDAQRTSYTSQVVPTPWRWKWVWNGPNASGAVPVGKFGLPRNSQPVTGGGRVYIAAGSRGVYALNQQTGGVQWNANPGGAKINSTPAYDPRSDSLLVLSSNGTLYKLNAANGAILDQFASGATSQLPLPPALHGERVWFSMGTKVFALRTDSLEKVWEYAAGSPVHTPPAYSPSFDRVIVATQDLYVHAIRNNDGMQAWRVKPTPLSPGNGLDQAEVANGWPVIAEDHGLALVRLRLDWETIWQPWSPWPSDNVTMRNGLSAQPKYQVLYALRLSDGVAPFILNVGNGGFGDGGYLPMGPAPVVKRFTDGQEVAYVVMRGSPCLANPCDGRWDARLGELMLDSSTVTGYQAGYVRFMDNTFFPTDEMAYVSMAGDQIFAGHWEAGIAHRIVDRSASRGSGANPITTQDLPHIATSQDEDVCGSGFRSSHYCASGLKNTRVWPAGFYIYWQEGAVYDRYWSEYATWVVSNNTVYFVSTDGALVALENGNPATSTSELENETPKQSALAQSIQPAVNPGIISYTEARRYAGQVVTVEGVLRYVFNNYKAVYLGFKNPHQGELVVRIPKEDWVNFPQPPESLYQLGMKVRVTGLIGWYQGDPQILVSDPSQIEVVSEPE